MTNQHASDCALHSEPAYPAGPCDCHLSIESRLDEMIRHAYQGSTEAAEEIRQELVERYKAMQPAPVQEHQHALEQALTRLQKRYGELESKVAAQREWVGLTDEEVMNCYLFWVVDLQDIIGFYKGIEAKLKEKNNG